VASYDHTSRTPKPVLLNCIQPDPAWRTYVLAWAAQGPRFMTLGTLPSRSPQAWTRCAREGVIHGDRNSENILFGWFESICSYPIPSLKGTLQHAPRSPHSRFAVPNTTG
jgi:hypothetical protein